MAKKIKKRVLPSIEVIIVLVFFLSFIAWAMSQCSAKKSSNVDETEEDLAEDATAESSPVSSMITELTQSNTPDRPTSEANRQNTSNGLSSTGQTTSSTSRPVEPPKVETVYATKLFVTIDGLKFRTGPSMDSTILLILPINQELEFMNEVSDSTQTISLGNGVTANERWIKVRHWKGHEGWVYGAGVNYFKAAAQTPSSLTQ